MYTKIIFQRVIGLTSLLLCGVLSAADVRPFMQLDSFSHSEPVAIDALFHEWHDSFHGGGVVLTRTRGEAGVEAGPWRLGVIQRLDYQVAMSRDTAEFIYLTNNHKELEQGRRYRLSAEVHHLYSSGLALAYRGEFNDSLSFELSGELLEGRKLTSGSISGYAHALQANDYDFAFVVDYAYSRDGLFGRQASAPSGQGYSLGFSLNYEPQDRLAFGLDVDDVYGQVDWRDAPYTYATATSATKSYGDDGYVVYEPALSGIESYQDYQQTLPWHARLSARYRPTPSDVLSLSYDYYQIKGFASVGFQHQVLPGFGLGGGLNLDARAYGLTLTYGGLSLQLVGDAARLEDMRTLGLSLAFSFLL